MADDQPTIEGHEWLTAIHDAIQAKYAAKVTEMMGDQVDVPEAKSAVVTRWVVAAEFMLEDGDRVVHTACSQNLMKWEARGLLQYTLDSYHTP